jgi:putative transposase
MPRSARIVITGIPHHITQRGNRGDNIFIDDSDRETYLNIMLKQYERYGLIVHGYCLMSNHVHLVATPIKDDSLAKAIGQGHHLYSKAFNAKNHQFGHVWHSRFYSCPLDEPHLFNALVYVDRNPVRTGLVRKPWDWMWSSASAHISMIDTSGLIDMDWWFCFNGRSGWRKIILEEQAMAEVEDIRRHTQSGRPLGSENFIRELERTLGYPVRLNQRGRPRKRK